jgi:2-phospho-L-lactate guanylyltransferase
VRWTVLIPAKSLPGAKSRLVAATADPARHRELVEAIRADTVAAAHAAAPVARVVLVLDRPGPSAGLTFVQTAPGLNAALAEAAADAAARWPADGIAALVGDLPAVRPDELAAALDAAAAHERAFVRDADGTGTTLLTAAPQVSLSPAFGAGSAARHERVAAELAAGPGLRHDVDTPDDLAAAAGLGLGPATAALGFVTGCSPAACMIDG